MAEDPKEPDERAPIWRVGEVQVLPKRARRQRAEGDEGLEDDPAERDGDDEEAVVEVAISSEAPVRRIDWMTGREFLEVLGHAEGEIDMSYARDGLPLFVDHNSRDMVGLVHPVRLDGDGRLRGPVRWSRSARAREIRQDVEDGIRTKVSVGYDYDATSYTETKSGDEVIRRFTGWRPLEVSSVPIPADYEVGVGRSARPGARRPELITPGTPAEKAKESTVTQSGTPADAAGGARAGIAAEHAEIAALARQHNMTDRLADWIGQSATLEQVRGEILAQYRAKEQALVTRGGGGDVLDLSDREAKQFSFARAIANAAAGKRGYEHEVSDELYRKLGKTPSNPAAILVPTQLLGRYGSAPMQRMEVATSGAGQQLKFTEYGGFLEILRPRLRIAQLGAQTLSGLQGDVSFVTNPSANTFQWGAETAAPTATNLGTALKTMAPKNGAALTNYTRQLLAQSVESVEALVQNDLMKIIAIAIDRAAIQGTGSTQPTGIISTSGIGSVTMGANGAVPTFPKLVDLWSEVAADNADADGMAYLVTPRIAGQLAKTEQFSGTSGLPIWTWASQNEGRVNGMRAVHSNNVPSTLTKGTNTGVCHAVIFGDFSQLVIGEWGAIELVVDPYKQKPVIIEVAAHVMVDVMLRYPESFAAILDTLVS